MAPESPLIVLKAKIMTCLKQVVKPRRHVLIVGSSLLALSLPFPHYPHERTPHVAGSCAVSDLGMFSLRKHLNLDRHASEAARAYRGHPCGGLQEASLRVNHVGGRLQE